MKHIRPENKNTIAILCMNGKSGANKKIKNDKTNDVIAAISTLKAVSYTHLTLPTTPYV